MFLVLLPVLLRSDLFYGEARRTTLANLSRPAGMPMACVEGGNR